MTAEFVLSQITIVASVAIGVLGVIKIHKDHVNGEVEKAREKSVGAKAIADVVSKLSDHERIINNHEDQLKDMEKRQDKMDSEYLETLKDVLNHYIKK